MNATCKVCHRSYPFDLMTVVIYKLFLPAAIPRVTRTLRPGSHILDCCMPCKLLVRNATKGTPISEPLTDPVDVQMLEASKAHLEATGQKPHPALRAEVTA